MAIESLTRPCWTYTCAADHHDRTGSRQHETHRAWLELPADCDRPYQLDSACVQAICDGCGTDFHHPADDTHGTWHFASLGHADQELTNAGWTTANQHWHCPDCPAFLTLTDTAHTILRHAA
jgi:hypothetical protein